MANETPLTVVGNVTKDQELTFTAGGDARVVFTVASTPRTYDRESAEWRDSEPMYLECTAWRQLAENIAESLSKGARVVVSGRLRQRHWETDQGEKRSRIAVEADDIGPSLRFATAAIHKTQKQPGVSRDVGDSTATEPPF